MLRIRDIQLAFKGYLNIFRIFMTKDIKRMPHLDEKFKEFAKLNLAVDNKAFIPQRARMEKMRF